MNQKLPITNQLLKFDLDFNITFKHKLIDEGEIICCSRNKGVNFYLHTSKRMTILDIKSSKVVEIPLQTKSFPHLV